MGADNRGCGYSNWLRNVKGMSMGIAQALSVKPAFSVLAMYERHCCNMMTRNAMAFA